ncbi:hypothetical protein, conserved [Babesia bigemina]|uniref:Uncharacterized protein n=1 Tax=Babesia bigemina TaxID=5866 RepID=A0A061DDS9_BABBI|nr:hypothetical protein, conserved [Babesia bigemina]CDR96540.1 hypothetical protein, conserved [Babesia bigemina]|eukprot:XP_012768726.1 hypothetical protein, conserved [Babesia bigemina]
MSEGTGSQSGEAHARPGSERRASAVLPAIPLPAPELCLLNARPLSCLYSSQYARTQRKRIRRAVTRCEASDVEDCLYNEDDNHVHYYRRSTDAGDDEPLPEATPSEIRKELQVCEALLAHIGVRIASKRNALALLGLNVMHGNRRVGFMSRALRYGVPCMPMSAMVNTLQARNANGSVPASTDDSAYPRPTPYTDISWGLEDPDLLRGKLHEVVEDALAGLGKDPDGNDAVSFKDILKLPLLTSNAYSLLGPSSLVLPDDVLSEDLLLPTLSGPGRGNGPAGKAKKKAKASESAKSVSFKAKPDIYDKPLSSPIRFIGIGIQEGAASGDATPKSPSRLRDPADGRGSSDRLKLLVSQGKVQPASKRPCGSSEDEKIASTDRRSLVSNEGEVDRADEDDGDSDYLVNGGERVKRPSRDRSRAERRDGQSKEKRNEKLPPESELTVDQMVQNLRNGKLCNGKDPKNLRDLIISILVAGLYEFLPVEFFNEFLQDRRLLQCLRQIRRRPNPET